MSKSNYNKVDLNVNGKISLKRKKKKKKIKLNHLKENNGLNIVHHSMIQDQDETLNTRKMNDDETDIIKLEKMSKAIKTLIECLGENPNREGLIKTPLRMAKALLYCTKGYAQDLNLLLNDATFHEDHNEMVVVRNIELYSLCEHHMVPFIGKVHIGYIPNGKVLGLSKLARISDMYARRLQVQERLTRDIATAIMDVIKPLGVGVVIEATHMCMTMRGVEKASSSTVTSSVLGCFQSDSRTRNEFFSLIHRPNPFS